MKFALDEQQRDFAASVERDQLAVIAAHRQALNGARLTAASMTTAKMPTATWAAVPDQSDQGCFVLDCSAIPQFPGRPRSRWTVAAAP